MARPPLVLRLCLVLTQIIVAIVEIALAVLTTHIFGICVGIATLASVCLVLHRQATRGYWEKLERQCCPPEKKPRKNGGGDEDDTEMDQLRQGPMDFDNIEVEFDDPNIVIDEQHNTVNWTARLIYWTAFVLIILCITLITITILSGPMPQWTPENAPVACTHENQDGCASAWLALSDHEHSDIEIFNLEWEDPPPHHTYERMSSKETVAGLSSSVEKFLTNHGLVTILKNEKVKYGSPSSVIAHIDLIDPFYDTALPTLVANLESLNSNVSATDLGQMPVKPELESRVGGVLVEWDFGSVNIAGNLWWAISEAKSCASSNSGKILAKTAPFSTTSKKWAFLDGFKLAQFEAHTLLLKGDGGVYACGILTPSHEESESSLYTLGGGTFFQARAVSPWFGAPTDMYVEVFAACPNSTAAAVAGAWLCPSNPSNLDVNGVMYIHSQTRGKAYGKPNGLVDALVAYIQRN